MAAFENCEVFLLAICNTFGTIKPPPPWGAAINLGFERKGSSKNAKWHSFEGHLMKYVRDTKLQSYWGILIKNIAESFTLPSKLRAKTNV